MPMTTKAHYCYSCNAGIILGYWSTVGFSESPILAVFSPMMIVEYIDIVIMLLLVLPWTILHC